MFSLWKPWETTPAWYRVATFLTVNEELNPKFHTLSFNAINNLTLSRHLFQCRPILQERMRFFPEPREVNRFQISRLLRTRDHGPKSSSVDAWRPSDLSLGNSPVGKFVTYVILGNGRKAEAAQHGIFIKRISFERSSAVIYVEMSAIMQPDSSQCNECIKSLCCPVRIVCVLILVVNSLLAGA